MKRKYKHTDELHLEYEERKQRILKRLAEYRKIDSSQYFYELLYCLMTPQSRAVHAGAAQKKFEELQFKENECDPEIVLSDARHYIRFHKTKSKWIREMKLNYTEIASAIASKISAVEKREWLVQHINGLSYKEATHFLRNIGQNDGLTILDRHILKNLKYYGVIRMLPPSMTKKRYAAIEKKFQLFSGEIGISVDELDLLFWSNETGEILK